MDALRTDLYQLTMAQAYWHHRRHTQRACFHLFYRRPPFGGSYVVMAGLAHALAYLKDLRFDHQALDFLRDRGGFRNEFLTMLATAELDLDIWAMAEGELVAPHTPMMRVEGPLWQVQWVESALLNAIGFESLVATKAARICDAARTDEGEREPVLEFGLRRAQGPDGSLRASRAAFLGGCSGTSHVAAGAAFGIPIRGTHAHSWVMAFGDDERAFEAYSATFPDDSVFLVDTFDTREGIDAAVRVGLRMKAQGHALKAIRLDSGDLASLARLARQRLDEAGLQDVRIIASNDLDEQRIRALKAEGAPIDMWGVGTRLVTAYDQPALGCVYKLAALEEEGRWRARRKWSDDVIKRSIPGRQEVWRLADGRDVVTRVGAVDPGNASVRRCRSLSAQGLGAEQDLDMRAARPLLEQVMAGGRHLARPSQEDENLRQARQRALGAIDALPLEHRAMHEAKPLAVYLDAPLAREFETSPVRHAAAGQRPSQLEMNR